MADTYSYTAYSGARNIDVRCFHFSDGTGLTNQIAFDTSILSSPPGQHMKIRRLKYSINTEAVRLQWEATTPIDFLYLSQGQDILDFSREYAGGWPNDARNTAGVTGNILLTTYGQIAGSGFSLIFEAIAGI